ncbi:ABC transporter substrate-binding protein [Lacrimispora sphenoides]|uniref:Multiple sugar transport system substrate-binding protein n=1 Tax=Lacrimispora sphenoides JCM 1415 TaxID=1297793 RepID=A0ABY1CBL2_9FIRM|nr:ABC transporter substrate-binding protein [Lacrimispora sphenoides]SET87586.1 multiple sugar transport system substrate-binding protein [[Clostridium] sphenoides JCM 1415]SUY51976.1 extracellular solute-binding protein [Lacrimispora sphenoides]
MKRAIGIIMAAGMAAMAVTGCGSGSQTQATTAQTTAAGGETTSGETSAPAENKEAQVITFWYNNTGDEAAVYEKAISEYNASQSNYKVEGLSVTDAQKVIVAMSSNESPDVIKISNQTVVQYQKNGLLENLQPYADKESFDSSIYSEQAMNANTIDRNIYALPLDAYTIQMYYNKELLKEAGYTEPPKTMEEMYEMAVKATKVDGSGNIEVLGYPLFPYASARQELIYGFGGRWWDEDSNVTPDNAGILDSLNMNIKYRNQFGGKALDGFIGTANTNRYTEQDMFFQGKQLFRLDGSWLPTMMKNFNSTVDYGITLIPGTQANPELRGTSRYETDSVAVPAMAKNKDGAWDFTKWLCSQEGAKIIDLGTGNLPAVKALYDDADIKAVPGFTEFIDALKQEKGIQYPVMADYDEYISMINAALDTVYSGSKTPEDALKALAAQSANLK